VTRGRRLRWRLASWCFAAAPLTRGLASRHLADPAILPDVHANPVLQSAASATAFREPEAVVGEPVGGGVRRPDRRKATGTSRGLPSTTKGCLTAPAGLTTDADGELRLTPLSLSWASLPRLSMPAGPFVNL
jgi:hypothetical protein